MDDAETAGNDASAGIYARESEYLGRYVQIGVAGGRLLSLSFPESADPGADDDHELLDRIFAYLEGKRDGFRDVAVALAAATADHHILTAVREIPYGEQASVKQVARMADLDPEDGDDLQRVRQALDDNPTPLVVPDHRVRDGPSAAPPVIEQRLRSVEGL
ncbi:MGMT family protein [Salinirubellus sp. GCM10025818]|jgi:methylated-DNA-[protein]-cysteine S-methyltransferase|uniref:MGMT family protein n=1 Tax=Salinirubellus TaxID=2162630 RepID=UPI0030CAA7AE